MPRKFTNINGNKILKNKKNLKRKIAPQKKEFSKNKKIGKLLKKEKCTYERVLQCINSSCDLDKIYKMAVEFDHMYLQCADTKTVSREIVIKELKEINLMHLDLIQQQDEQLTTKDKIIKALQEENKNLRARLERIERRLSLSVQKKTSKVAPISVQTDFPSDVSSCLTIKSELSPQSNEQKLISRLHSPSSAPVSPRPPIHIDSVETPKNVKKEASKKSPNKSSQHSPSSPQISPSLRVSPREKRVKKESNSSEALEFTINNNNLESELNDANFIESTGDDLSSLGNKRLINDDHVASYKKSKNYNLSKDLKEEELTDHNLRSRDKIKELNKDPKFHNNELVPPPVITQPDVIGEVSTDTDKDVSKSTVAPDLKKSRTRSKVETRKVRSDGILITEVPYFVNSPNYATEFSPLINEPEESEGQVEIPRWRTKILTSLYVMEGTENLEDEIFHKRHAKLEQDERRRKRWDLQRMREQRQYEKLRERYEVRNNRNDSNSGYHVSLWPTLESTHFLEISDSLPVCAFGQPLAKISECEFSLPWVSETVSSSTRRRKR